MKTITLTNPIRIGNQSEVTELQFNDLEAGMLRGFKQEDPMGSMLDLAGKLCGQVSAVMNKLRGKDYKAVMEHVTAEMADFL